MILEHMIHPEQVRAGVVLLDYGLVERVLSDPTPSHRRCQTALPAYHIPVESGYIPYLLASGSTKDIPETRVLVSTEGRPLGFVPKGSLPEVGDFLARRGGNHRGYVGQVLEVDGDRIAVTAAYRDTGGRVWHTWPMGRGYEVVVEGRRG